MATSQSFCLLDISAVGVELRWGHNLVVIGTNRGERHDFRVFHRSQTDDYRRVLQRIYPDHYYEFGFDSGLKSSGSDSVACSTITTEKPRDFGTIQ
jgi:hypothetical protein